MSKIDIINGTGNMNLNKWKILIKIYHTNIGEQILSKVVFNAVFPEVQDSISSKANILKNEIIMGR